MANKTKSAREILNEVLVGKYANTTIKKIGKITKEIAYEISVVNNGMYYGQTALTIVTLPKKILVSTFANKSLALEEVKSLKALKNEHELIVELLNK